MSDQPRMVIFGDSVWEPGLTANLVATGTWTGEDRPMELRIRRDDGTPPSADDVRRVLGWIEQGVLKVERP